MKRIFQSNYLDISNWITTDFGKFVATQTNFSCVVGFHIPELLLPPNREANNLLKIHQNYLNLK